MVKVPTVNGYGDFNVEPYSDYRKRWPVELSAFPEELIENWVYRHWNDFKDYWLPNGAMDWHYEKRMFSNQEIMEISHHGDWLDTLDYWGDELLRKKFRQNTWLGSYMLKNGTTPSPILVFENGGKIEHPKGIENEKFCVPLQLVEGHMRTAYLRGLIRNKHENLKEEHIVFVAT